MPEGFTVGRIIEEDRNVFEEKLFENDVNDVEDENGNDVIRCENIELFTLIEMDKDDREESMTLADKDKLDL